MNVVRKKWEKLPIWVKNLYLIQVYNSWWNYIIYLILIFIRLAALELEDGFMRRTVTPSGRDQVFKDAVFLTGKTSLPYFRNDLCWLEPITGHEKVNLMDEEQFWHMCDSAWIIYCNWICSLVKLWHPLTGRSLDTSCTFVFYVNWQWFCDLALKTRALWPCQM